MTESVSKKFAGLSEKLAFCSKRDDAYTCVIDSFNDADLETVNRIVRVWEMTKNSSPPTDREKKEDRIVVIPTGSQIVPYEKEMGEIKEIKKELREIVKIAGEDTQKKKEKKGSSEIRRSAIISAFIFIIIFVIVLVGWVIMYMGWSEWEREERDERSRSGEERKKDSCWVVEWILGAVGFISILGVLTVLLV